MTDWYRLDLGNGMDARPKTSEIMGEFSAMFIASGMRPTGALLFSRYDTRQDNVELYFNPQAADIARRHGAKACSKPELNEFRMGLLSADLPDALSTNFPNQTRA